jgi:hypothetical protein
MNATDRRALERLRALAREATTGPVGAAATDLEDAGIPTDRHAEVLARLRECRSSWQGGEPRALYDALDLADGWAQDFGRELEDPPEQMDPRELAKAVLGEPSAAEDPDSPRALARGIEL